MEKVTTALGYYLNIVRDNLRLNPQSEGEIISELETRIEDEYFLNPGTARAKDKAPPTV